MRNRSPENADSVLFANELISCIANCATEGEVQEATTMIVRYFLFQVFAFVVMVRRGAREHYRYLLGCDPQLCYRYIQNKWYAIDPFIDYALQNTSPILASDVPSRSAGQQRMRLDAETHGFRGSVAIPAHSSSSSLIGVLYLGTDEGAGRARQNLATHRNLMRALAMELLEWCELRRHDNNFSALNLDKLDLDLLYKAQEHATSQDAAYELGITLSLVKARYRQLAFKLEAPTKRYAVERAVELGLIKPSS